jgi:hypothetical protein
MSDYNNFIIGNISKVRWHTYLHQISEDNYGHMAESYDEENLIEEIIKTKDSDGNITDIYPSIKINDTMDIDKNYAMVSIDMERNILVRNFFDSKHPNGFDQKNTYFPDDIAFKFMLSDTNNKLLNYIKLDRPNQTNIKNIDYILYYCVEYELYEGLNINLLNYCISLERKCNSINNRLDGIYNTIDNRLKIIETEIAETRRQVIKTVNNNPMTYLTNIKFPFF